MSTLVRYVCKVVLFVLIIAVSGVGVAQAQTDPGVSPPIPDAMTDSPTSGVITPDVVQQSVRLYATGEQIIPSPTVSVTGNAEYWFYDRLWIPFKNVTGGAAWTFFKINGEEDHFFVELSGGASGGPVYDSEEHNAILEVEVYMDAQYGTARLQQWDPSSPVSLEGRTIFSIDYPGASITSDLVPFEDSELTPYATPTWYSIQLLTDDYSESDIRDQHSSVNGTAVLRWEGGPPWGIYKSIYVRAISSPSMEEFEFGSRSPR